MPPQVGFEFVRNFGILGSHHHLLIVVLSKWFGNVFFLCNSIDRFAIRQANQDATPTGPVSVTVLITINLVLDRS